METYFFRLGGNKLRFTLINTIKRRNNKPEETESYNPTDEIIRDFYSEW